MSKISFKLAKNQYLKHLQLNIPKNRCSFLIAPTGSGKTTFTMEELKDQFPIVIILVPTQAKVMELQNEYASPQAKDSKYLFFYANQSPEESVNRFKGVIVSTYDKFEKIMKLMTPLQKQKTLLVIDESHKLYSAGSFRDDALTPIIWHLQKRTIPSILFLTATKTPDLFDQLQVRIDQEYLIQHTHPIPRNIEVVSLSKGDHNTCVVLIEKRIKILRKKYSQQVKNFCRKTIIVRVNSREKCHNLQRYFTQKYKLKCLVVHSKSKNDVNVREIFETQKIPHGVDIVFTTSIMDEAVNLNNSQLEIDSVFIIGKQAHPEELVQFIGRLRLANVPCYIVLHTPINHTPDDPLKIHQKHLNRLKDFIKRIFNLGQALASLHNDYTFQMEDGEKPNIYDKVNRMNESFNDWFGCKLFAVYKGESIQNIASLVSTLYQMDMGQFYSSFEYLEWRIRQFLPNSNIQFTEYTEMTTPQYVKAFFDEEKSNADHAYNESIDTGIELFLNHFPKLINHHKSLKEISLKFIQKKQTDEDYLFDLVLLEGDHIPYPEHVTQVLNETVTLAQHITNLHDIRDILVQKKFQQTIKIAKAYQDNEFVRYIAKRLYTRSPEKYLIDNYRLNGVQACKLVNQTIKVVQKNTGLPMRTIIKQKLIKGISYDHETDEIQVTASKALNFIETYFEVHDRNKNKPDKRYLEFFGIAVGGFEYIHLKALQQPFLQVKKSFILNKKYYDTYTGQIIKTKL